LSHARLRQHVTNPHKTSLVPTSLQETRELDAIDPCTCSWTILVRGTYAHAYLDNMASETDPSYVEEAHEPSIPSRSLSISRNISTLTQVVSAASSGGCTLPQRAISSTTARHSLGTNDRVSSSLLRDDIERRPLDSNRTTRRSASCSAKTRKSMHPTKIQRWSGLTRTVSDWDHGLRRVCRTSCTSNVC
jgi:hypothetical protein